MRFVWTAIRKDWSRVRRDPFALGTWLAIPVILAVLLTLVFGRGETVPQGRLLVADQDDSIASNVLVSGFSREPLSKMLLVEKVSEADGQERINRGDGSAFLLIPAGFQTAFLSNQPFRLTLMTNPSEAIIPQIVKESLSIMVDAAFYVQRVAGSQLRSLEAQASSYASLGPATGSIIGSMASLQHYLNPRVIDLETQVVARKPARNFATTFLPSMIFMGMLLIAGGLAIDIWRERMMGTLRRLMISPAPLSAFLTGRLIFVGMVFGLVSLVGLVAAKGLAGMKAVNLPAAILWLTFTGMAFYLLMLVIALIPSTARAASVMSNLVTFPLAMIGGCFFPFEWMPDWMARIGRVTPNGWAITQFKAILAGEVNAAQMAVAVTGLTVVSAAMFFVALRRLRSEVAA
jgi:ABC-type multidrug transport system permease subunit